MPKLPRHRNTTNPIIWCGAILCAILAVVVIISGIVVFIGYLTIKPKIPKVSVASAQLNTLYFDQASLLTVQVTIVIKAENDNTHAHVSFYSTSYTLSMGGGPKIAYLVGSPFSLGPNKSVELSYMTQSGAIPLNPEEADVVNLSLRRGLMKFKLSGGSRSRWHYGFIGSFKFSLHLYCEMQLPVDGSVVFPRCSSTMK